MSEIHTGSCLCGHVRFHVEGGFEHFFLCHCEYCRKDTGSAHGANLFSAEGKLTWLAGGDRVTTFRLPSTRHLRSFCSICGSALPCQESGDGVLVVPAGSLDSPVAIRPNAHIFVGSRANWDRELENIPAFDQFPS